MRLRVSNSISSILMLLLWYPISMEAQTLYQPTVHILSSGLSREKAIDLPRMTRVLTDMMRGYAPPIKYPAPIKPIECELIIDLINIQGNRYTGDIAFKVYRPIYGQSSRSLLIQGVMTDVTFMMDPYAPPTMVSGTIPEEEWGRRLFYLQTIGAALYYDSFGNNGGQPFYNLLQRRAEAFNILSDDDRRLTGILTPSAFIPYLQTPSADLFRESWYIYHRDGLDQSSSDPSRYIDTLETVLTALQKVSDESPSDPLIRLFADSKSGEIRQYLEQSDLTQRQHVNDLMSNLFPNFQL